MLAPLLIMLREGLEAALVIGIIATYLRRSGRSEWLPAVWVGVLLAVAVSFFAGATLQVLHAGFPQRTQEIFEAVVALAAVAVLTWMVFWMRSAARSIRSGLERDLDAAFDGPGRATIWALVSMAFLAVAREGLESVFFLLAIFQQSPGPGAPLAALAGVAIAAGLGIGIYSGGVRLDLRRFFRISGLFILLVAAGLVSGALRSLHEAGLWNALQERVWDLSAVLPGSSVVGSVLSALVGYQESPALGEFLVWGLYLSVTLVLFLRPAPATPARAA